MKRNKRSGSKSICLAPSILRPLVKLFHQAGYKRRLKRICAALDIKPYKWQADYALKDNVLLVGGRCSGKTMAVILRALLHAPSTSEELMAILRQDPDAARSRYIQRFVYDEYRRCYAQCVKAGAIPNKPTPAIKLDNLDDRRDGCFRKALGNRI